MKPPDSKTYLALSDRIIHGDNPTIDEYRSIAKMPDELVFNLLAGSDRLRNASMGQSIHLCTISNGKSGKCTEDCSFCSQSSVSKSPIKKYPLLSKHELQQGIQEVIGRPVNRYSIVTRGKSLAKKEVQIVAEAISEFNPSPLGFCVSLGTLKEAEFAILFNAGVTRYHHNLETARSHYSTLCSTHSYEERVETIRLAKNAGMSVCSGGIFGVGESEEQILELALALKQLDVDSIPINFLTPIKGTPLESYHFLTPLRCLKIIALFRYVLPDKEIIVCGGRIQSLKGLHPLIFYAGASGIMTGNYLTTAGQTLESDSNLLESLALPPRKVS